MRKIRLFFNPSCAYCLTLKKFLEKNNILFQSIDISKNKQARQDMINGSGQIGLPVLAIDKEFIVGFDREKICKSLNIKT
ncbi:MAG: glutaredoxin domain-containing protein [Patescibacteria group bacterium]|nr:glutaredoxin domain-containing protein [Patescibacteria group bacterium]